MILETKIEEIIKDIETGNKSLRDVIYDYEARLDIQPKEESPIDKFLSQLMDIEFDIDEAKHELYSLRYEIKKLNKK